MILSIGLIFGGYVILRCIEMQWASETRYSGKSFCTLIAACSMLLTSAFGQTISGLDSPQKTKVAPATAQDLEPDVRNVRWGMTRGQVKATEPGKPAEEEGAYGYDVTVGALHVFVQYVFSKQDALSTIFYQFTEKHSNQNLFIQDFDVVESALTEKYGRAESAEMRWSDELLRSDRSKYGLAVSAGHAQYISRWTTKRLTILHWMHGDNYKIQHIVAYRPLDYEEDSESKAKARKDY